MMLRKADRQPTVKVFDRRLVSVASVTVLGSMMSILDTTIVNVALNTLVRTFHTTFASIQWVSTAYLLAIATVIPLTRWIMDRFGTRRAFMSSITLFLIGSLLCGLAWSMTSLIVFRVIQGIGGGMIMPIGQTVIAREAGPERIGRVMTVVGVPQLLGPMIGPVLGGLILSSVSWRWIFLVNVPIGVVAIIRARKVLTRGDVATGARIRLDVVGLLLLSPGLTLLVYGISEFGNSGHFTSLVLLTSALGLCLIGGFFVHSLRSAHPLLDLRLWKNRGFAMSTVTGFLFSSAMSAGLFLVPLYCQLAQGDSPLRSGVVMAGGGLGAMIAMPYAGKIMDRSGARRIVPVGLLLFSMAMYPFTLVGAHSNELLLAFFWFLRGAGGGCSMTPALAAGYATLQPGQISSATSVNSIAQRVGGSLGVALAAVILQLRLTHLLPGLGRGGVAALSYAQRAQHAPAIAHAFGFVFWIMVVISFIAIFPALRLPAKRAKIGPQKSEPNSAAEQLSNVASLTVE